MFAPSVARWQIGRYRRQGRTDEESAVRAFFETTVLRLAALELPAFLFLVAYLMSSGLVALVGAAAAVVLMAALFPSRAGFERFRAELSGGRDGRFAPR